MAIKYQPGKVYLRDRRNGVEYEYEANLAANSNIETFTPNEVDIKASNKALETTGENTAADTTGTVPDTEQNTTPVAQQAAEAAEANQAAKDAAPAAPAKVVATVAKPANRAAVRVPPKPANRVPPKPASRK